MSVTLYKDGDDFNPPLSQLQKISENAASDEILGLIKGVKEYLDQEASLAWALEGKEYKNEELLLENLVSKVSHPDEWAAYQELKNNHPVLDIQNHKIKSTYLEEEEESKLHIQALNKLYKTDGYTLENLLYFKKYNTSLVPGLDIIGSLILAQKNFKGGVEHEIELAQKENNAVNSFLTQIKEAFKKFQANKGENEAKDLKTAVDVVEELLVERRDEILAKRIANSDYSALLNLSSDASSS